MARIGGNKRDNVLDGTDDADRILGRTGDDTLDGGKGADALFGGEGTDTLYGGNGNDFIDGGFGAYDRMYGGAGDDTFRQFTYGLQLSPDYGDQIYGGDGIDTIDNSWMKQSFRGDASEIIFDSIERFVLTNHDDSFDVGCWLSGTTFYGGKGNDTIRTFTSDTVLYGGAGDDYLSGAPYNGLGDPDNVIFGGAGADTLKGHEGDDRLYGGGGADYIEGGQGTDIIKAGGGADTIWLTGGYQYGEGTEKVWGGRGADTFLIQDIYQNNTGKRIMIADFKAEDTIRFNDMTYGDPSILPHDFDDLLDRATETRKGVSIEYSEGRTLFLKGLDIDDLHEDSFSYYYSGWQVGLD